MSDKHRLTTPLVFSDFIRNAPPEEKETVYDDMMQRATEAQENIILLRPRSLSQTHLGKEWLEYARRLEAENERLVCDAFEQRKRALAAEAALDDAKRKVVDAQIHYVTALREERDRLQERREGASDRAEAMEIWKERAERAEYVLRERSDGGLAEIKDDVGARICAMDLHSLDGEAVKEACAKVCENEIRTYCWEDESLATAEHIAMVIRALDLGQINAAEQLKVSCPAALAAERKQRESIRDSWGW